MTYREGCKCLHVDVCMYRSTCGPRVQIATSTETGHSWDAALMHTHLVPLEMPCVSHSSTQSCHTHQRDLQVPQILLQQELVVQQDTQGMFKRLWMQQKTLKFRRVLSWSWIPLTALLSFQSFWQHRTSWCSLCIKQTSEFPPVTHNIAPIISTGIINVCSVG